MRRPAPRTTDILDMTSRAGLESLRWRGILSLRPPFSRSSSRGAGCDAFWIRALRPHEDRGLFSTGPTLHSTASVSTDLPFPPFRIISRCRERSGRGQTPSGAVHEVPAHTAAQPPPRPSATPPRAGQPPSHPLPPASQRVPLPPPAVPHPRHAAAQPHVHIRHGCLTQSRGVRAPGSPLRQSQIGGYPTPFLFPVIGISPYRHKKPSFAPPFHGHREKNDPPVSIPLVPQEKSHVPPAAPSPSSLQPRQTRRKARRPEILERSLEALASALRPAPLGAGHPWKAGSL